MINLKDLTSLMISISEFKSNVSQIINEKLTKIIVKNNEPVAVIMPYAEYAKNIEDAETGKALLGRIGQDITLDNGVQIMICAAKEENCFCIKTFIKMKTSGDYKLHFTQYLSTPSVDQTLTSEELCKQYLPSMKNKK